MGTVADKIQYTYNAIADIKLALQSKGIDITGVPLNRYGNLIRGLGSITGSKIAFDTVLFQENNNYLIDLNYDTYEGITIPEYTTASYLESDYTPVVEGDAVVDVSTMANTETEEV